MYVKSHTILGKANRVDANEKAAEIKLYSKFFYITKGSAAN